MDKQVTFICGGELVPASRYRVHPVSEHLSRNGWATSIIHGYGSLDQRLSSANVRRIYRGFCRARRAIHTGLLTVDGPVMVQRLAIPWFSGPEQRLSSACDGLVFDFDDAVFLGNDGTENSWRRKALDLVFSKSSHVVAGNTWLAQAVTVDVPVSVIPTCIDTTRYVPAYHDKIDATVKIGWIGTGNNFGYLTQLIEPLNKLRAKGLLFDLEICSDEVDAGLFSLLKAKYVKWSPEVELPFLQSLDIGLMPLADDDWCRGKCSFKMIQYMSVGCPVVASSVGMNRDVLDGEQGGRLVDGDAWFTPLAELIESFEYRMSVGRAARQRAVDRYDIEVAVESYRRIFDSLS